MKKFEFSLQKILEYKIHIQKNEQNTLQLMQQGYYRLCMQMDQMKNHYEHLKTVLKKKYETGVEVMELAYTQRYISELQKQMLEQRRKIEIAEKQVEMQRQKLVEATKEKVSLEKLKEKHFAAYQVLERKENENFISEFVNNTAASA